MVVLITFALLLLSIAAIIVLRLTRPGAPYTWLAAAAGALFTWVSILFWQLDLPWQLALGQWSPQTLFHASPQLLAGQLSWLYALSLSALVAAVVLTSPARVSQARVASWLGTLSFAVLGLLAVLMDNPLGLVLVWMAIDLAEFVVAMRTRLSPALTQRSVMAFTVRLVGTGFAMWAGVIGAAGGQPFTLESTPGQVGIYLLLAAGLRLGVLPLHLVYRDEPVMRRGFGTVLRMTAAATSLVLLARLPAATLDPAWLPVLLAFVAIVAVYSGWKWLMASDDLDGRPYWVAGMGSLSIASALGGSASGATAWGVALILFGGISFLYSARQTWFTRVFAALGLLLLGLPFTLTASGWQIEFPLPFLFWPLFLTAHVLLASGYIRHLLQPGETRLADHPSWARAAYPIGMAVPVASLVIGGVWGWPGALSPGSWQIAAIALLLWVVVAFVLLRLPQFAILEALAQWNTRPSRYTVLVGLPARFVRWLYRLASQLVMYVSALLEGDGGLLWTLLLLVLLVSFLRGR